jgi:hypothetical protein
VWIHGLIGGATPYLRYFVIGIMRIQVDLEDATIKADHHGASDKEMRLSLSVRSAEDTPHPSV